MIRYYFAMLKCFTLRRLWNFVIVEISYLISLITRWVFIAGKPWAASVEPTTSCNLQCTECPTGMQTLTRAKGNMNLEEFSTIINKLAPDLLYLNLYFQGEPLLNPHFAEMIKLARDKKIFVSTSTNGHFLDDTTIEKLLKSDLNHLIISMDGMDQKTYEKYRVNGDLQKVKDGLERLIAAKKKNNTHFPIVELQFLVLKHNQHQMQAMKAFAKTTGIDKLTFKSAQIYNFNNAEGVIPTLKEKSRYRKNADGSWMVTRKISNRCHRLWSSIVITWEGRVVPCCYDKNAEYQSGNLLEESLSAIWKNPGNTIFRKKILNNRSEIEICRNCGE